jgi:beta-N-acetylhexosaminidase
MRESGVESPVVATDHEGGAVSALAPVVGAGPSAATLGLADDESWTARVHFERGRAIRDLGISLVLAPVADVDRPGNPVIGTRAFGTDARICARQVAAAVRGLQAAGLRCCLKHWPGHGSTLADSHLELPPLEIGERERMATDHLPFAAGLRAGAQALMVAHLRAPQEWGAGDGPLSASAAAISRLRDELAFDGPVIADALEMHGYCGLTADDAINAGCDLVILARPIESCLDELDRLSPLPELTWPTARGEIPGERVREWSVVEEGDAPCPGEGPPSAWQVEDHASGDRLLRVPGIDLDFSHRMDVAPERFAGIFAAAPSGGAAAGFAALAVRPVPEALLDRMRAGESAPGRRFSAFFGALALDPRLGPPPAGVWRLRSPEVRPENVARVLREWEGRIRALF